MYDVIIAGGGPTGAALAIELSMNNIKTLVIEKYEKPLLSPRAQSLSSRTMEFFMRWQIADALKEKILLHPDFPLQAVWCSKLNGKTYGIGEMNKKLGELQTPQLAVHNPLWITEDILRKRLAAFPSVTFLKSQEIVDVKIMQDRVTVTAKDINQQTKNYEASYMVGCDGANSVTRNKIGIEFKSLAPAQRVINVMFKAPELEKNITVDKGFMYSLLENSTFGVIGTVDPDEGIWYAQIFYQGNATHIEQIDLKHMLEELVGFTFNKQIMHSYIWNMHTQLAHSFSKGNRVFLVGDSAHTFCPTGGFGLNTGFGDALNLGWKLAAVVQHRAKPTLLKTYEQERRPVCLRNLQAAQENADEMIALQKKYNSKKNSEEFAQANANRAIEHTQSFGIHMGYAYFDSPLTMLQENQLTEPMAKHIYTPTALPGYFLPHCLITEERSIYTELSTTRWTLLISDQVDKALVNKWQKNFCANIMDLDVLEVEQGIYPYRYMLIRPDWHIAFATDELNSQYIENFTQN